MSIKTLSLGLVAALAIAAAPAHAISDAQQLKLDSVIAQSDLSAADLVEALLQQFPELSAEIVKGVVEARPAEAAEVVAKALEVAPAQAADIISVAIAAAPTAAASIAQVARAAEVSNVTITQAALIAGVDPTDVSVATAAGIEAPIPAAPTAPSQGGNAGNGGGISNS